MGKTMMALSYEITYVGGIKQCKSMDCFQRDFPCNLVIVCNSALFGLVVASTTICMFFSTLGNDTS